MMTARTIIDRHITWDNHGCLPLRPDDASFLPLLQRYRAAGFDMAVINIGFGDDGPEQHLRMAAHFRHWLAARPEDYSLVDTADDIVRARAEGKLAIAFDMEGANGIADQPSLLQLYYDLGVRWMLMAYNRSNRVGSGCMDEEDGGLTAFGRQVVDEMERVGMVACCSHTGRRTAIDLLSRATRPVLFSHSNASAIQQHPRNIDDGMIRACAATGGVVGINGIGDFLGTPDCDLEDAFVRHLDHMVQLVGPHHVGLAFDHVFDVAELEAYIATQSALFPPGTMAPVFRQLSFEAIEGIVERLLKLGYSDDDIAAILGGNLMRVARQVWKPRRGAASA